jgi:cell division protein FtsW
VINDKRVLRQALLAVAMLGFLVVVADLGTALVPVITAVIVFWIAGLERRYMVRVMLLGLAFVMIAICSKGYRLGRIIAYVDPEYRITETFDRWGWCVPTLRIPVPGAIRVINRDNPKSPWARAVCSVWA